VCSSDLWLKLKDKPVGFNKELYFNLENDHRYHFSKDNLFISAVHPAFYKKGKDYERIILEDEQDYSNKIVKAALDWKEI
jgi:hypothetical protein